MNTRLISQRTAVAALALTTAGAIAYATQPATATETAAATAAQAPANVMTIVESAPAGLEAAVSPAQAAPMQAAAQVSTSPATTTYGPARPATTTRTVDGKTQWLVNSGLDSSSGETTAERDAVGPIFTMTSTRANTINRMEASCVHGSLAGAVSDLTVTTNAAIQSVTLPDDGQFVVTFEQSLRDTGATAEVRWRCMRWSDDQLLR